MSVLHGIARIIQIASRSQSGRLFVRFSRGLSRHAAGKYAVRGAQRYLGVRYETMHALDQFIFNETIECAVRIAATLMENEFEAHFSDQQIDQAAETNAGAIYHATEQAVRSRMISKGYDLVQTRVFGAIDRQGQLVIGTDIIKQAILAALGEILDIDRHDMA